MEGETEKRVEGKTKGKKKKKEIGRDEMEMQGVKEGIIVVAFDRFAQVDNAKKGSIWRLVKSGQLGLIWSRWMVMLV